MRSASLPSCAFMKRSSTEEQVMNSKAAQRVRLRAFLSSDRDALFVLSPWVLVACAQCERVKSTVRLSMRRLPFCPSSYRHRFLRQRVLYRRFRVTVRLLQTWCLRFMKRSSVLSPGPHMMKTRRDAECRLVGVEDECAQCCVTPRESVLTSVVKRGIASYLPLMVRSPMPW